jgi:hypothetical protein
MAIRRLSIKKKNSAQSHHFYALFQIFITKNRYFQVFLFKSELNKIKSIIISNIMGKR